MQAHRKRKGSSTMKRDGLIPLKNEYQPSGPTVPLDTTASGLQKNGNFEVHVKIEHLFINYSLQVNFVCSCFQS